MGANNDMLSYNLFAYCSNNPVNYSDPNGDMFGEAILLGAATIVAAATVITTIIAATPTLQQGFAAIGAAIQNAAVGVYNGAVNIAKSFAADYSDIQEKEKEKDITVPEQPKKQAFFTVDPYSFHPKGLIMKEYPGTKNGRIIEWRDPISQAKIFEWDEDINNGAHYHVMMIEWNGNHHGLHYLPGTPVPEPWNSIYFGG